jgi:hypothetical protein
LTEVQCKELKEALNLLDAGENNRKYGTTDANIKSSRSHCIFRIKLKIRELISCVIKESLVNIIDLAGSECVEKTNSQGVTKQEGENINKSLLYLSNVIRALSEKARTGKDKTYVNYRDSKLTRILQPSLSGNCMTSVICTVNCS